MTERDFLRNNWLALESVSRYRALSEGEAKDLEELRRVFGPLPSRDSREATGHMDLDAPLTLFGLPVVCSDTGEPMTRRDVMGPGDELRPAERN